MKRTWILVIALGAGLAIGLVLNASLVTAPEKWPVPARGTEPQPQAGNGQTGLAGFVKSRFLENPAAGAEPYLAERTRQRTQVRSPFRSSAILGQAIEDLPIDVLVELLSARKLASRDEVERVFARLAEVDPLWAMELKRKAWFPSIEQMDAATQTVYRVWVRSDAVAALDWTYALHASGLRQASSLSLTEEWLKVDPAAVAAHFDRLQHARGYGHFSEGFERQLMGAWVAKDRAAAETWLDGLEAGGKKDQLAKALEAVTPDD